MGHEAETKGFTASVREPLPDFPGQWSVIWETQAVTSPDFVREADDFFQELADRHDAEYDVRTGAMTLGPQGVFKPVAGPVKATLGSRKLKTYDVELRDGAIYLTS